MTDSRRKTAYYAHADTPFGPMLVAGSGRKLVAIKFNVPKKRVAAAVEELHRELHASFALVHDETKVAPLVDQVSAYLSGARTAFDVELDLSWVTPFRRDVLLECARVPRGQVATYADLARRVGRPNAYRAVGNTMRTNPIPIVIPCHRIVGSNGSLTGFGGGLDMKVKLLQLEGASLNLN
jgi:O-6-methylguanine DNA methyltransferase